MVELISKLTHYCVSLYSIKDSPSVKQLNRRAIRGKHQISGMDL